MCIWAFRLCPSKSFPTHLEGKVLRMRETLGGTQVFLGFVWRIPGAIEASDWKPRQMVLSHVVGYKQCSVIMSRDRTFHYFKCKSLSLVLDCKHKVILANVSEKRDLSEVYPSAHKWTGRPRKWAGAEVKIHREPSQGCAVRLVSVGLQGQPRLPPDRCGNGTAGIWPTPFVFVSFRQDSKSLDGKSSWPSWGCPSCYNLPASEWEIEPTPRFT